MQDLVLFVARSACVGFLAAVGFVAALLWFDIGGLWQLVAGTGLGWMAVALLILFNGIVFSAVHFANGVARLNEAAIRLPSTHRGR